MTTGILLTCEDEKIILKGMDHLRINKELYYSFAHPVNANKFSYPLIVLFHMSTKNKDGGVVKYIGRIIGIKQYEQSDHKDPLRKPVEWIEERAHNVDNRNYRTSFIIDKIEPYDYVTKELELLMGGNVKRGNQNYQTIILPNEVVNVIERLGWIKTSTV